MDTSAHYRIVTYRLGDLCIMVRSAAEGYIHNEDVEASQDVENKTPASKVQQECDNMTIISGGQLIPNSTTLELNTCSKYRVGDDGLEKNIRKSWLSQDAHFILAKYVITEKSKRDSNWDGDFTKLRAKFLNDDIKHYDSVKYTTDWAKNNAEVIQVFHDTLMDLVQRIRDAGAKGKGDTFMVRYVGEEVDFTAEKGVGAVSTELCERMKAGSGDGK